MNSSFLIQHYTPKLALISTPQFSPTSLIHCHLHVNSSDIFRHVILNEQNADRKHRRVNLTFIGLNPARRSVFGFSSPAFHPTSLLPRFHAATISCFTFCFFPFFPLIISYFVFRFVSQQKQSFLRLLWNFVLLINTD